MLDTIRVNLRIGERIRIIDCGVDYGWFFVVDVTADKVVLRPIDTPEEFR